MLFRPARAADLDEVCTLLATARHDPEYFHALFKADPGFDPAQIRVAWTGGRIVACAKLYPRALRFGTTVVPAGGVGNLRTDPRYWSKGLGSSLLSECLAALYLDGMALAPLFSARHTLFLRRGWHPLRETVLEIAPTALARAEPLPDEEETRVRPFEATDLDAVMALHESANAARTGSAVRDRNDWLRCLTTLDLHGAMALVAERDDEIVGYAAIQPQDHARPFSEVLELLLAPWAEQVWRPVLRAAQELGGATAMLCAGLPADYRRAIVAASGAGVSLVERDDLMMRVVDPATLLRQLLPQLAARLRAQPVEAPLRVRIGPLRGGTALALHDTGLAIERPHRDDAYILPEAAFLALLLGTESAAEQLAVTLPALPDTLRQTLLHLFPPQDWVFWRSDAF